MTRRQLPQTSVIPSPSSIFLPGTSSTDSGPPRSSAAATTIATPAMTPLPIPDRTAQKPPDSTNNTPAAPDGSKDDTFPLPRLRLEIRDLTHPGSPRFLSAINTTDILTKAVQNVLRILYASPNQKDTHLPSTRSVTLILRGMNGVAYTTGTELDDDHKEIHFSLDYIKGIEPQNGLDRAAHEIEGVLTHELVHTMQYNGRGCCPGGLIEGIADFVRLNCDLSPPHWKQNVDGKWDRGYQHTAYFLQYLENRFGDGTVRRINEKLRAQKYEEKPFWTELVGRPVEQLWKDYVKYFKAGAAS